MPLLDILEDTETVVIEKEEYDCRFSGCMTPAVWLGVASCCSENTTYCNPHKRQQEEVFLRGIVRGRTPIHFDCGNPTKEVVWTLI